MFTLRIPMARSDLLLSLVKSGVSGDPNLFRWTVEAIVAEERAKNHGVLADRLEEQLKRNGQPAGNGQPIIAGPVAHDLFYELTSERRLDDLVLPEQVRGACLELVEEFHRPPLPLILHSSTSMIPLTCFIASFFAISMPRSPSPQNHSVRRVRPAAGCRRRCTWIPLPLWHLAFLSLRCSSLQATVDLPSSRAWPGACVRLRSVGSNRPFDESENHGHLPTYQG